MAKKSGAVEEHDDELRPVTLPSGALFYVYSQEAQYFSDRVRRYLKDNSFTNVADLQDVDRMIMLELLVWRWSTWVSQQKDYWGDGVDEGALSKTIKETSAELRLLKRALGVDKVSRDKQRGEDSVENYLANLRVRAREFGYMRDKQTAKAIELFQELKAILTLHDNTDAEEQRELHCTTEDVMKWIRDSALPQFDEIDEHFRTTNQKTWIRRQ